MIREFTDEQLINELERRKIKHIPLEKPKMLNDIDFSNLTILVDEYINFIGSNEYYDDNDYRYDIYEHVMETFYGTKIWKWINSKT